MTILTYQYRIKDSSSKNLLIRMSAQVNFVWNFCRDVIEKNWKESRKYTSESQLSLLTKGASKDLDINAQTIQAVGQGLLLKTRKNKKLIKKRSRKHKLGWIPFKGQSFKFLGNYSLYNGHKIRYWLHRPLPEGYIIKTGSFCEDSLGNWFLNLVVSFPEYLTPSKTEEDVGVDLGIKTIAALSTGGKETRDNISKQFEKKLARAQRHKNKRQEKKIHLKIKNKRKDWNHKTTYYLTENYRRIFVGDTSSNSILTEITKINRAVYDAGWYSLKTLLSYKVLRRQGVYLEVPEQKSNEICSFCLKEKTEKLTLDIREWICSNCNTLHDRDINAARNHLRFGSESLSS